MSSSSSSSCLFTICVQDFCAAKFFALFLAASPVYVTRFRLPFPIALWPTSFLGNDKGELVRGGPPRGEILFTFCLRENRVGLMLGVEIGVGSNEVRGDNNGRSDRDCGDEGKGWDRD